MFVNIKMNLCAEQKFLIKWKAKSRVETIKRPAKQEGIIDSVN